MRATDKTPGDPDGPMPQAPEAGPGTSPRESGEKPAQPAKFQRSQGALQRAKTKFLESWAGDLWGRLSAVDFMNESIMLAATFLLCAVPFLIIATALAGRSAASGLTLRLGLNKQAAADLDHLFASSSATSAAVTGTSWVFFVLGGLAAASTVQALYRKVFRVGPGKGDKLLALGWLGLVVGCGALAAAAGREFYGGAPALWWILSVPALIGFWWFTMWFLLAGRIAWRRLVPCAVATGLFWIGMLVVFHFTFSDMVTSSDQEYGPIGVVLDLMSFFIAIGVVITLGATMGMMWRDRGLSLRAAAGKTRRAA